MLPTIFHQVLMEWWCRVPGRLGSTAWEDEKGWGDDNWDEPGAMQAKGYMVWLLAPLLVHVRFACLNGALRVVSAPALSGLRGAGDARQACRCSLCPYAPGGMVWCLGAANWQACSMHVCIKCH